MVTAQQARQNVASAIRLQAQALGFYSNDGSGFNARNITADERIALTNAVAAYILANPAPFDTGATDLTNPVRSAPLIYNTPLQADDSPVSDFADHLTENILAAGNKVAGIGNGVLNAAETASWLIPAAAVVFVGILLYAQFKKRTA